MSEKPRIVRTPKHNIPIGEVFKDSNGHYNLKIKKPKGSEVEEIPMDKLIQMVITEAEK